MRTPSRALLAAAIFVMLCIALSSAGHLLSTSSAVPALREKRSSPSDLEVSGEIAALPPGSTRYITRDDLLALPQVTYTVTDDTNFKVATHVSGLLLEELVRHLGAAPNSDLMVAICRDRYRANYPRAYVSAHHPLLVLKVNGKPPENWPKDVEGHGMDMGPYMISHPRFTPSFKILSHEDEPQIPWGVVQIEFRDAKTVFGAIAPRGPHAAEPAVEAGYRIAQQNCFRCHNMGEEGGQKAGYPWPALSALATASPQDFATYIHNPQAKDPKAQMPGNPGYDNATIRALISYFKTFSPQGKENRGN